MHDLPGSGFIEACRLRLVLLKLPAKVLVISTSVVGAPPTGQSGQSPSCTDSCISAERIRAHAISLYITAVDCQLLSLEYTHALITG